MEIDPERMRHMIMKMKPVFQERLWGGKKLATRFNYSLPSNQIGECWGISAHPNGESIVMDGMYEGRTLADLWENERHLFGDYPGDMFPLLIKILDAADDLSVQVHPDDFQARKLEGVPYGKTECWYVVEAEEGAELIIGHTARSKKEMCDRVDKGEWELLLKSQSVKKGDFFFVPSGTVHAIGKGIVILETQQSSDTTYRLYDFGREDASGHKRDLHLDKGLAVTTIPHEPFNPDTNSRQVSGGCIKRLVEVPEFNVYHVQASGGFELRAINRFRAITILSGEGYIGRLEVRAGDHLMICTGASFQVDGNLEWIMSDVPLDSSVLD